jgi:hypothetical protein
LEKIAKLIKSIKKIDKGNELLFIVAATLGKYLFMIPLPTRGIIRDITSNDTILNIGIENSVLKKT